MNGVGNSALYDLWVFTLSNYDYTSDFDVCFPLHQFVVSDIMLAKDHVMIEGGTDYRRQMQMTESGTATWTKPLARRSRHIGRVLAELQIPWRQVYAQQTTSMAELRRNRGKSKLKNLQKSKRIDAKLQLAKSFEQRFWLTPDDSGDETNLWGAPWYVVPITGAQVTAATHGHQGTVPFYADATSPTTVANINPTTWPRFANYNDVWSNASGALAEADILKIGRMFRHLHWRAPAFIEDLKKGPLNKMRLLTDETLIEALEKSARSQNDSLGADVARYTGAGIVTLNAQGGPMVKGMPPTWVEELDTANTTLRGAHPFYMLNGNNMRFAVEQGMYLAEDTPPRDVEQPDAATTYYDLSGNIVIGDRQTVGGVISYVAAA